MTLAELNSILKSIPGFEKKVAYRAFPKGKAPALPFICYLATQTNNFDADNTVYHVIQNVDIESKSEARRMIEKFVDDNPEAVAGLLKTWINQEWGA